MQYELPLDRKDKEEDFIFMNILLIFPAKIAECLSFSGIGPSFSLRPGYEDEDRYTERVCP